jgi:hypothetical protein
MRKFIAIAAVLTALAAHTTAAWARCAPGTNYSCSQGYNGKVICGCR